MREERLQHQGSKNQKVFSWQQEAMHSVLGLHLQGLGLPQHCPAHRRGGQLRTDTSYLSSTAIPLTLCLFLGTHAAPKGEHDLTLVQSSQRGKGILYCPCARTAALSATVLPCCRLTSTTHALRAPLCTGSLYPLCQPKSTVASAPSKQLRRGSPAASSPASPLE